MKYIFSIYLVSVQYHVKELLNILYRITKTNVPQSDNLWNQIRLFTNWHIVSHPHHLCMMIHHINFMWDRDERHKCWRHLSWCFLYRYISIWWGKQPSHSIFQIICMQFCSALSFYGYISLIPMWVIWIHFLYFPWLLHWNRSNHLIATVSLK